MLNVTICALIALVFSLSLIEITYADGIVLDLDGNRYVLVLRYFHNLIILMESNATNSNFGGEPFKQSLFPPILGITAFIGGIVGAVIICVYGKDSHVLDDDEGKESIGN